MSFFLGVRSAWGSARLNSIRIVADLGDEDNVCHNLYVRWVSWVGLGTTIQSRLGRMSSIRVK